MKSSSLTASIDRVEGNGRAPKLSPAYAGWHDLAVHSGMSKRWLQANVPLHLRFQTGGKILVKLTEFDAWFETFRQGRDLAAIEEELLK